MKNRKQRILIVILVGLVFFSSSLALLMYSKQNQAKETNETFIEVFASSKTLKQGVLIGANDISVIKVAKSNLSYTPLIQGEIIGRYTSVDILKGEQFRKEKISLVRILAVKSSEDGKIIEAVKVQTEVLGPIVFKDTITLPLTLFKNIDNTLKKGDYIDILSIKGKHSKGKEVSFKTKYIALHVSINSFVRQYSSVDTFVSIDAEKKLLMADSVVFEMNPDDIKNLLSVYYKSQALNSNRVYNTSKSNIGHLWMVKCSETIDEKAQKKKKKMLADYVVPRRKRSNSSSVRISYEN